MNVQPTQPRFLLQALSHWREEARLGRSNVSNPSPIRMDRSALAGAMASIVSPKTAASATNEEVRKGSRIKSGELHIFIFRNLFLPASQTGIARAGVPATKRILRLQISFNQATNFVFRPTVFANAFNQCLMRIFDDCQGFFQAVGAAWIRLGRDRLACISALCERLPPVRCHKWRITLPVPAEQSEHIRNAQKRNLSISLIP